MYPFRETADPYRVLVSEILLRKTTARQVANIYGEFFAKFPTVEDLCRARLEEIIEIIKPLGIVTRANDLLLAAKTIVQEYKGTVPSDKDLLTQLRGVGRYIANCVLSFGYGKTVPMVDSNVERVLSRVSNLPTNKQGAKGEFWQIYSELAPIKKRREFHYALIDLAHKICTPRSPKCSDCPISRCCKYPCAHASHSTS